MISSVKKENLEKALNIVERVTTKSTSLPILSNILLETDGNFLKLSSTNLEAGAQYWIRAKIEKEGKITVPARVLSGFIKYLPDSSRVELKEKKGVLHVDSGRTQTKINGLDSDDFPILPEIDDGESATLSCVNFAQTLEQVIGSASASGIKPEISGVYLHLEKNLLTATATDSFRLSEKKMKVDVDISQDYSVIIPQEAASFLKFVLESRGGDFELKLSSNLIMVSLIEDEKPVLRFVSKLIEGKYPNYKEIIPQEMVSGARLLRNDFLNQLKQASLFASRINEVKIKFDPKEEEVEIFCQNAELGEYQSSFSADISGEEREVSFNYKFLQDGVSTVKGNEILFSLSENKSTDGPALIKSVDEDGYLYVVMPIQPS